MKLDKCIIRLLYTGDVICFADVCWFGKGKAVLN